MEPSLPVVAPLERALFLRSQDLFRDLHGRQLAALAQLTREDWLRRGTVLQRQGERVRRVHLLVEGSLRCERDGHVLRRIDAPDTVGLIELLAGVGASASAVADGNALALVLEGDTFVDVLEDEFALVLDLRAALGREVRRRREASGVRGPLPAAAAGPRVDAPAAALPLVEHLLRLHRAPELGCFGPGVLAALLRDRGEVRLEPGDELWKEGEEARFLFVVAAGRIAAAQETNTVSAGAGAVLGLEEAFCALPHAYTARAETETSGIRIDVSSLLDAAEDHFHVAARILAYGARLLLQRQEADAAAPSKEARP